jgi:hypothetical protein
MLNNPHATTGVILANPLLRTGVSFKPEEENPVKLRSPADRQITNKLPPSNATSMKTIDKDIHSICLSI